MNRKHWCEGGKGKGEEGGETREFQVTVRTRWVEKQEGLG
jgi:hypothetical protein